jgi:hypothetical protein
MHGLTWASRRKQRHREPTPATERPSPTTDRRRFLTGGAIGAATAAAGAGIVAGAQRAAALPRRVLMGFSGNQEPDPLLIGRENANLDPGGTTELHGSTAAAGSSMAQISQNSTGVSTRVLEITHTGNASFAIGLLAEITSASGTAVGGRVEGDGDFAVGVAGETVGTGDQTGVVGLRRNQPGGSGVFGLSETADAVGVKAQSQLGAALHLVDDNLTMPPTTGAWQAGSFVVSGGQLWFCFDGPGNLWAQLTTTFVPAEAPVRVYDSRPGEDPLGVDKGQLNPGQERVVDVGLNDAVPTFASAVLCNLSVVSTVNAGFLAMFKDGVPYPGHSSVNWSASNQIIGNNATSGVDIDNAEVNVRVRCGGSGGTHFVVDVLGHYLGGQPPV